MTTTTTPTADPAMIRAALDVLFTPGDVVELRIPEIARGRTVSGYYDDFDRLTADAVSLNRKFGTAYITLNQLNPSLLARRANRYEDWAKQTTSDSEIIRRRWFFIDADAVRPAGISATDAELSAALRRAAEVQEFLDAAGWPAPVEAVSGNGGHLLYPIDVPNDDASRALLERCLKALDLRFSDSVVKVDTTTFNASRLVKLYGTATGKGDSTADRPHRLARIAYPKGRTDMIAPALSRELLEALAAELPEEPDPRRNGRILLGASSFDLDQWIEDHGLPVVASGPWQQGGYKWVLNPCVWNPEHQNRAAYVVRLASGAIGAGCHHNGCQGKGWHELRALYENRAVTAAVSADAAVDTRGAAETPAFPVDVLPAVAGALVEEGAASLRCPSDLVGVPLLAMAAGVIGNRQSIELKPGYQQRAIVWAGTIAEPGTAKSPAQAVVQSCLDVLQRAAHEQRAAAKEAYQRDLDAWQSADKQSRGPRPESPPDEEHYYTTDSTTEGVAKMLGGEGSQTPGFVVIRDELSGWVLSFDAYRASKGGDRQTWLSMWAGMPFKSDRVSRESIYVPEPAVSVAGGIQPDLLPTLAAESGERDGFIERFLFSYPITGPMRWTDAYVRPETRDGLTAAFRRLRRAPAGVVQLHRDARRLYTDWVDANADLQTGVSGFLRGAYAKLPNQAARLALVLHCLAYPDAPSAERVSAQTMAGALTLTEYFRAHGHKALAHFGAAALVSHPLAVRVLRVLDGAGGAWVRTSVLHERLGGHVKATALAAALAELEGARLAEQRTILPEPQGGRPQVEWRHVRELTEVTELTVGMGRDVGVNSVTSVNSQGEAAEDGTVSGGRAGAGAALHPCPGCGAQITGRPSARCFRCLINEGEMTHDNHV